MTTKVSAGLTSIPLKNYIINPTFSINQRVFAGGALADGIYGYDRWKASDAVGASNVTLVGVIATINSGLLVQVVEDFGYLGSVTVSWTGTATVNGGNSSPFTYTKIVGNDTLTFGVGTLSEVKFEIGNQVTPFEYPDIGSELAKCQRYFEQLNSNAGNDNGLCVAQVVSTTIAYGTIEYSIKRAVPAITISNVAGFTISRATGSRTFTSNVTPVKIGDTRVKLDFREAGATLVAGDAAYVDIRSAWINIDAEL